MFDMLLPMLSIYQEYVRNHHYSLQVIPRTLNNRFLQLNFRQKFFIGKSGLKVYPEKLSWSTTDSDFT